MPKSDENLKQPHPRKNGGIKTLFTQRIAETEGERRGKSNKAFLLAHWDEITEALSAGWNMRAIWNYLHLKGFFPGGYNTFVRCVRMEQARKPLPALTQVNNENVVSASAQSHSPPPVTQGFIYSPDSDAKDLI